MWCLIATEGALFAYLLFCYYYIAAQAPAPLAAGGRAQAGHRAARHRSSCSPAASRSGGASAASSAAGRGQLRSAWRPRWCSASSSSACRCCEWRHKPLHASTPGRLRLAVLHHHRLPHGARRRRAADAARAAGLDAARLLRPAPALAPCRSARSTGTSSTSSGWRCSRRSTCCRTSGSRHEHRRTPPWRSTPAHPAPHRAKASLASLWIGLLLAPAAWFLQLTIDTALLGNACDTGQRAPGARRGRRAAGRARGRRGRPGRSPSVAAAVAWRNWRRTAGGTARRAATTCWPAATAARASWRWPGC